MAQGIVNLTFSDSLIPARIEIVLQEEPSIQWDADTGVTEALKQVLDAKEADPHLVQKVTAHLASHQADVAALLIPESNAGSGVTFAVPSPPSAVHAPLAHRILAISLLGRLPHGETFDLLGTRNSLAHELGHLLGADHDRFTQVIRHRDAAYDHVRGYTPESRRFTTIMGYTSAAYGTVRLNRFSSPDLTWQGHPLGVAIGQPEATDAAAFLRLSTQVMAKYKTTPSSPPLRTLLTGLTPALAGTILVDALGPYVAGSKVKISALPRSGDYRFQQW